MRQKMNAKRGVKFPNARTVDDAQAFQDYLSPEKVKERKANDQLALTQLAADLPSLTRCLYASALSNTGNPDDTKKATELLTQVVGKDPGYLMQPPDSLAYTVAGNAIRNTKALNNDAFLKACNQNNQNVDGMPVDVWISQWAIPTERPQEPANAPAGPPAPNGRGEMAPPAPNRPGDKAIPPPPGGQLRIEADPPAPGELEERDAPPDPDRGGGGGGEPSPRREPQ
jgi:hypothetical protein